MQELYRILVSNISICIPSLLVSAVTCVIFVDDIFYADELAFPIAHVTCKHVHVICSQ